MGQGIDCKLVTHAVLEPGLGIVWAAEVGLRRSQSQSPCTHWPTIIISVSMIIEGRWLLLALLLLLPPPPPPLLLLLLLLLHDSERATEKENLPAQRRRQRPDRIPNCTRSSKSTSTSATSSHLTALVCSSVISLPPSLPPVPLFSICPVLSYPKPRTSKYGGTRQAPGPFRLGKSGGGSV